MGRLRQLPINALNGGIFTAEGATLKLDSQKNGWKGYFFNQKHNGYEKFVPVRALGGRCVSIRQKTRNRKTSLS